MSACILIVSQVYVPDPAAVGQYLHDVAREWVRRGYRVHVLTAATAHHDASLNYPAAEVIDGVHVERLPWSNLGKRRLRLRLLGAASFLLQALPRALRLGPVAHLLITTSPPLAPVFGLGLARLLRARLLFWVMDINPDQAIAAGAVAADSLPARGLDQALVRTLRGADKVVVLDRFMHERLERKLRRPLVSSVIPPWPLAEVSYVPHAENPFRARHGLNGKFVVMYSGNLSEVHPLDTLLATAERLKDAVDIVFVLIGDGTARARIEAWRAARPAVKLRLLPYQPQAELRFSLAAADLHVVSMGEQQVGIVHPSKVYGALAAARPFLFFGPERSHLGEMVGAHGVGFRVAHGDGAAAELLIRQLSQQTEAERGALSQNARRVLLQHFSREYWLKRFCDLVEKPG